MNCTKDEYFALIEQNFDRLKPLISQISGVLLEDLVAKSFSDFPTDVFKHQVERSNDFYKFLEKLGYPQTARLFVLYNKLKARSVRVYDRLTMPWRYRKTRAFVSPDFKNTIYFKTSRKERKSATEGDIYITTAHEMFHVAAHRFEQPNIVDFLPDTEIAQANGLLQGMWRAGLYGIELSKVQHAWSEMAEGYAYYFSIEVLGRFDGNLYPGEREKHRRRWQNLIAYQFFKALDTHIPNNEDNLGRLAYLSPPRNFDEMNNPKVYIDRVNRETRQM